MAVGAGSIKRASKANAEATTKKAVIEEVQVEPKTTVVEEQSQPEKDVTAPVKATKTTTTRKPAAKKAAVEKTTVKKEKKAPAAEPIKQKKGNEACRLTEEMPVHLL